jgi:hypothetical protein
MTAHMNHFPLMARFNQWANGGTGAGRNGLEL